MYHRKLSTITITTKSIFNSSPLQIRPDKRVQLSFSDEPLSRKAECSSKSDVVMDHISSSNSFGSNVTLVGNRIDVASDACDVASGAHAHGFDVVAYKADNGVKSNRCVMFC